MSFRLGMNMNHLDVTGVDRMACSKGQENLMFSHYNYNNYHYYQFLLVFVTDMTK
jgi:hypothetical protein